MYESQGLLSGSAVSLVGLLMPLECQKYAVVQYAVFVFSIAVQLLHKLSIHADDGPMKLMKVLYVCMCVCD